MLHYIGPSLNFMFQISQVCQPEMKMNKKYRKWCHSLLLICLISTVPQCTHLNKQKREWNKGGGQIGKGGERKTS